eukprot:CAMPEP_0113889166 /NCGR_PEP_ID=MMETSP0780_2-20120614/13321_1 /TAXON_ID=652834 /ORGANISM="Palpitomonas bilix" /LENGTH=274 /DNA_ID=CAMNT_0000878185 /DNA_START=62 /DNA_END=886 /DNA_ORIENTATION=- /assembly_acc=CAM_ASM_000599
MKKFEQQQSEATPAQRPAPVRRAKVVPPPQEEAKTEEKEKKPVAKESDGEKKEIESKKESSQADKESEKKEPEAQAPRARGKSISDRLKALQGSPGAAGGLFGAPLPMGGPPPMKTSAQKEGKEEKSDEKEEEEEDSKEKAMARRANMPRSHTVAESSPSASSVKNLRQGLAGKLPFGAPMAGGRVGGHGLSLSEEDLKSMLTKGKETPKSPEPSSKDEETSAEADSNNVGEELKHATTSRPKPRRKGRVSRVSSVRLSAGMGLEKTATEGDEA